MRLNYIFPVTVLCALGLGATLSFSACGGSTLAGFGGDSGAAVPDASTCPPCRTNADCNGGLCAQFQGDIFCAPACPNGNECATDRTCALETTASGDQASVCVPNGSACGQTVGPVSDGGPPPPPPGCDAGSTNTCGSLVGPTTAAKCNSCGTSHTCQANGCYGGWWCDTSTDKCHAPPTNCSGGGGGTCGGGGSDGGGGTFDAGTGPITGQVGPNGGTVSRLFFTTIGDTRPPSTDDTSGYPTAIADALYADITALNPAPLFSVSTGDYMFATPGNGQAAPQLDLYLAARAKFPGVFFPTMGNHECTGFTASNCGQGNADGLTDNYNQFLSKLLGPIGKTTPYYSFVIKATDGSWTSKFVFVAANAWDSGQASWLQTTMAQPTTYTFIVRHEPSSASTAPGVAPSDQIINAVPYTLLIVGHSHTYGHPSQKEVLFGNGGAPISGSANYGYGVFLQRPDGAIQVDAVDYQSGQADASFHFAVKPDGSPAP